VLLGREQPATDEITDFYDDASQHYAEDYSAERSTVAHFFRARQSIVLKILSERGGGELLDVGCGPGIYSEKAVALGYQYHGLDASPGMIHECMKRYSQLSDAQFHNGRVEDLPFEEDRFDVIMCLGSLEYVEPSKLPNAIGKLHRSLKPDGILVLSLLNRRSPHWWWMLHMYPYLQFLYRNTRAMVSGRKFASVQRDIPTKYFTVREAADLLRSMQFDIGSTRYFGYDLYPPPFDRWLFRALRRLTPSLEHLSAMPGLSPLSKAFIICATRKDQP
jgi:2-polyprenyl-3-methyl-5-hydroxy-6-metoxy-1,4-benzoquinol methylase